MKNLRDCKIESTITRNVTKNNAKTAMPKRCQPNGESVQSEFVQIMLMFRFLLISILLSSEVSMQEPNDLGSAQRPGNK